MNSRPGASRRRACSAVAVLAGLVAAALCVLLMQRRGPNVVGAPAASASPPADRPLQAQRLEAAPEKEQRGASEALVEDDAEGEPLSAAREAELALLERRLDAEEVQLENRRRSRERLEQALSRASDLSADQFAMLTTRKARLESKLAAQAERVERLERRIEAIEESW